MTPKPEDAPRSSATKWTTFTDVTVIPCAVCRGVGYHEVSCCSGVVQDLRAGRLRLVGTGE
jgi:hypothetical protein